MPGWGIDEYASLVAVIGFLATALAYAFRLALKPTNDNISRLNESMNVFNERISDTQDDVEDISKVVGNHETRLTVLEKITEKESVYRAPFSNGKEN